MKAKETTQQPVSVERLAEAVRMTMPDCKKGEALIAVVKKADSTAFIKWSGTGKDLLDSAYTLLQNDVSIAAIICRAAKDYIESLKADPNAWMRLTREVARYETETTTTEAETGTEAGKEAAS